MLKRLTFECWNCHRTYSLMLELAGKPKLAPECPYCAAVGVVELDPYRQDVVEVARSDSDAETALGADFNFPPVVPTRRPPDA